MTRTGITLLFILLSSNLLFSQVIKWANGTSNFGGEHNSGAVFTLGVIGSDDLSYYSFDALGPLVPYGAPLLASDGFFYATTNQGGDHNQGTVIKFDHLGNEPTILHHFDLSAGRLPSCTLIEATDGRLYGTTSEGGDHNYGTVFSILKNGTEFSTLHHFTEADGSNPWAGVTEGNDGMLYGVTLSDGDFSAGTIYRVSKNGSSFELLHTFNSDTEGNSSRCQLVEDTEGYFYGTLSFGSPEGAGSIFKVKADGTEFSILKSFGFSVEEGSSPMGNLLLSTDGKLYGGTFSGGTEFKGSVFSLETDGNNFATVHSFIGQEGERTYYGNRLLEHSDGYLYGTTIRGGTGGEGTIFKTSKDGSDFSVIENFDGKNGELAYTGLIAGPDEFFYGFTVLDNLTRFGLFYKINPDGSVFETVYDLTSANASGAVPNAGLDNAIQVWGTTTYGGENGYGVVFTSNGVRHTFDEMDGKWPWGKLVLLDDEGAYFGTCIAGGEHDRGTIFRIGRFDETFEVIYNFTELTNDGAAPQSGLLLADDGMLYGTTASGGEFGQGSVFRINPDGSGYEQLASFERDINGSAPTQPLIEGSNGKLYGVTIFGGELTSGDPSGTLFSLNKDGSAFSVLHVFENNETGSPSGPLLEKDGHLFGATDSGAAFESGSIYRIGLDGSDFTMIHEFMPSEGVSPRGGLTNDDFLITGTDFIYGVTRLGGEYGHGTVFRIMPDGSQFESIKSFTGSPDEPSQPNGDLRLDAIIVNANDLPRLTGLSLAPNPTAGEFRFVWENDFPSQNSARVRIIDERGSLVFQENTDLQTVNERLRQTSPTWGNGLYFVEVEMDGKVFAEQLVKGR